MEERLIIDAFNRLKSDGQNSVDNLIQWMKDANIIDGVKVTEADVRDQFSNVEDPTNVDLDTFKRVLSSLEAKQQKPPGGLSKMLAGFVKTGLTTAGAAAAAGFGVVTGAVASSVGDAIKGAISGKGSGAASGSTSGAARSAASGYGTKSGQSAPNDSLTSVKKDNEKEESEKDDSENEESEPEESEREEEHDDQSETTDPDDHSQK